jgi:cytochrome c oxidase subunit 1
MTFFKMPILVWAMLATSLITLTATQLIGLSFQLVLFERLLKMPFFEPAGGGDPLLFQHLFWFYSHPAVYIMILPGMGVESELIAAFSRRRVFGYKFVAAASMAIALLGFLVWGHHMFVSGQSMYAGMIFSILSFLIAIPSAIKVFNWTATLYKGTITFSAPMIYALGFIALFTVGGLTGLFLASIGVDVHVHDTYFVIAHFHFIMVGGMVMAYMGALHYWWPKVTGKMYPDWLGRISALTILLGFILTFLPQFLLGYLGMPRRYHTYPEEFQALNVFSTAGASILGVGYVLPLLYFFWSLKWGPAAGSNPWQAAGLEWQTTSPPPKDNFAETPIVTQEAYAYPEPEEVTRA